MSDISRSATLSNRLQNGRSVHHSICARQQRTERLVPFVSALCCFILLIICYPFPRITSSTLDDVSAAARHVYQVGEPHGYAGFLRLAGVFSSAVQMVSFFQMLCYAAAAMLLLMALRRVCPCCSRWLRILTCLGVSFCPSALIMTHVLTPDSICCALYLTALALLLFHISTQRPVHFAAFMAVCWLLCTLSCTAMLLPLFCAPVLLCTRGRRRLLKAGLLLALALVALHHTAGTFQASSQNRWTWVRSFKGWQNAQESIRILPYIDTDTLVFDDSELQNLHLFLSLRKGQLAEAGAAGSLTHYRHDHAHLLWQYMAYRMGLRMDRDKTAAAMWLELGILYDRYSKELIRRCPEKYFRKVVLTEAGQVFYPTHAGFLTAWSQETVKNSYLPAWFGLQKDANLSARHDFIPNILHSLALGHLLLWLIWTGTMGLYCVRRRRLEVDAGQTQALCLLTVFIIVYAVAAACSGPAEIRLWAPVYLAQWAAVRVALSSFQKSSHHLSK